MATSRREIERELGIAIRKDLGVPRGTKKLAEEVQAYAKLLWEESGPHPYETGDFVESIYAKKRPNRFGLPHWRVGSDNEHAGLLEYGSGPDKPGGHSPFGPDTPTPEFAIFARTAHHFKGTAP